MRELREFRVHHAEMRAAGLEVAGVSLDTLEAARRIAERLRLPYPLLSDPGRRAGDAFGVIHRVGLGGFRIELFRRTTFLVDLHGIVRAVWEKVKIRGHARDVMDVARGLGSMPV